MLPHRFCGEAGFSAGQAEAVLGVFESLLESARGGAGLEEAKTALRGQLLPHCADDSSAGQLGPADVKILMEYLTSTVLNHYVLYQHVFTVPQETETHEKTLVVQRADLLEPLGTAELEQPPRVEPEEAGPEGAGGEEATPEEAGGEEGGDGEGGGGEGEAAADGEGTSEAALEDMPQEDAIAVIIRQRLEQERQKLLAAQDSMQEEMLKKIDALRAA